MPSRVRVGLAGTGSYVPERVVPNSFFEALVDTSDEWIVQRTGIRSRHFNAPEQATSDLATLAGRRACEAASVDPKDLDLIIVGTLTPDHLLPACSVLVQQALGATKAGAFDVNAACTGFLTAMNTAEAFVASGRAKRVLAIGAESLSRFVDFKDRTSCILFGDAAGAAVFMPHDDCKQGEVLKSSLGADGTGYKFIHMTGGGSRLPPTHATIDNGDHYIRVAGRETYRFAVHKMAETIADMLEGHSYDDVAVVVPHQVNQRIIDGALERLGWNSDKVVVNIDRIGNTSAASVPVALDEAVRAGRMEKGKLVVLVAFGAGLTWGGALLRW
ncbi:MAG: beta-ketoacyl-ACP synthase III [Planctomycetota bacterium]|nr:beta-ketoacyl-ACP synthase III [Planctomycetota bacterium]